VPLVAVAEFMRRLDSVVAGPIHDEFVDTSPNDDQFTLF